jgi:TRAP-type C4-dicarboxylate transport system permease large subunit
MIIYGIFAEESIGKLLIAGVLPGILLTILFMISVSVVCARHPEWGPAGSATTLKQTAKSFASITDVAVLFLLVLGGLFIGWFGPNQAGAAGS